MQEAAKMNVGGLVNKLENNAEWVAFVLANYERLDSDLGKVFAHYTNFGGYNVITEVQRTLTDFSLLKFKLLDSPHLYSGMVKIGAALWLGKEIGIVPARWGKVGEKIAKGGAVAAIVLPGSEHPKCPITLDYGRGNSGTPQGYFY